MSTDNNKKIIDWDNGKISLDGAPASIINDIARGQRMKWHDVQFDVPKNDLDYISIIQFDNGTISIEIAPWRNGKYQGTQYMSCYLGMAKVTHWMPLPELPKGGEI
jgi:hypothetical protein